MPLICHPACQLQPPTLPIFCLHRGNQVISDLKSTTRHRILGQSKMATTNMNRKVGDLSVLDTECHHRSGGHRFIFLRKRRHHLLDRCTKFFGSCVFCLQ